MSLLGASTTVVTVGAMSAAKRVSTVAKSVQTFSSISIPSTNEPKLKFDLNLKPGLPLSAWQSGPPILDPIPKRGGQFQRGAFDIAIEEPKDFSGSTVLGGQQNISVGINLNADGSDDLVPVHP